MSTLAIAIATGAFAFLAGRLSAAWTIHRLRRLLAFALWTSGHDPLTGLPNRTYAEQLFNQRAAKHQPTVVALLDLDRLKQVNDTLGHQAGDQLLTVVADRLAHGARRYGGHAARLSGDEFLLLLPVNPTDPTEPVMSILAEIATPVQITTEDTVTLTPTATAGVAWFDGIDGTWSQLLRHADIALYHARTHGTGCETFHPRMRMPAPPAARLVRPVQRLRDGEASA